MFRRHGHAQHAKMRVELVRKLGDAMDRPAVGDRLRGCRADVKFDEAATRQPLLPESDNNGRPTGAGRCFPQFAAS